MFSGATAFVHFLIFAPLSFVRQKRSAFSYCQNTSQKGESKQNTLMASSISPSSSASRTVCLTCGDEGDTKLLIYCLKCQDSAVHQGCFIFNRESEGSLNILAHLSNKACEKALIAANRLPVQLDVELMAKSDIWPKSFLRLPPTDCSIALYLFPELESDENSYDALLEDLIDNDLAMNATIDNLELLIFSSRELPQQHWRLYRKYYLWGMFRHKSPSCSNIPTANVFAQTSSIQNAAISYLLNEVKGANTGCSQGQSFPSPLSILKGVNSGSLQGLFPRPLSSCYISTSTKDSPCHPGVRLINMEHECSRNLDTRNQDVGQHDTSRMLTSDICVSTQLNGVGDQFGPCLEPFRSKRRLSFSTMG